MCVQIVAMVPSPRDRVATFGKVGGGRYGSDGDILGRTVSTGCDGGVLR